MSSGTGEGSSLLGPGRENAPRKDSSSGRGLAALARGCDTLHKSRESGGARGEGQEVVEGEFQGQPAGRVRGMQIVQEFGCL